MSRCTFLTTVFQTEDQDEVRKLQATTLVEIFQERLNELLLRFPQADNEDDAGE